MRREKLWLIRLLMLVSMAGCSCSSSSGNPEAKTPSDSANGSSGNSSPDNGHSAATAVLAPSDGGNEPQIANADSANPKERTKKAQIVSSNGDKEEIIVRTEEQRKRWHELDSIERLKWRTMPPPQWRGVAQPKTTPVDSSGNK